MKGTTIDQSALQQGVFLLGNMLIWAVLIGILAPRPLGLGNFSLTMFREADTLPFFIYGTLLNALMVYSYAHFALPQYFKNSSVAYLIGVNVMYLLVFLLGESLIDYLYTRSIYQVKGYDRPWFSFGEWIKLNLIVTTGLMLVGNMYGFTFGWFKSRRRQQELEQAKLKAELTALKHQINPHFLFNVLNSLYGLAFKNDDEDTAEGIAKLSQLMRYMLYESNVSRVPLLREVTYIEDFIDLQRLRLSERVDIRFIVEGELNGMEIAPMILIPFIENAFKHGISTVRESLIYIQITALNKKLQLQVKNPIHPGSRKQSESAPGGIGLANVRQRLEMLYPQGYKLEIDDANGIYEINLRIEL